MSVILLSTVYIRSYVSIATQGNRYILGDVICIISTITIQSQTRVSNTQQEAGHVEAISVTI